MLLSMHHSFYENATGTHIRNETAAVAVYNGISCDVLGDLAWGSPCVLTQDLTGHERRKQYDID